MAEKKKAKKEKTENSKVDLKEILGDIKTVVSGEKETLFKVSEYKTIKLKKENLVAAGKEKYSFGEGNPNDQDLENIVRKIVRNELKNLELGYNTNRVRHEKEKNIKVTKSNYSTSSLKKSELIGLCKKIK